MNDENKQANQMTDIDPLLCVIGMPRSGTIWATRLIGQAINSPTQTRYAPTPFAYERDPAVWGSDRPGGLIRRLHLLGGPSTYAYQSPAILVVRHPGDTAISQSHRYDKEPNAVFRYLIGHWMSYYRAWSQDSRVLSIARYEDLHRNTQAELQVLVYDLIRAQVPIHSIPNVKDIAKAVYDNSFQRMKNHAKRKGNVGEWKTLLSKESIALWERASTEHEIIKEMGYA